MLISSGCSGTKRIDLKKNGHILVKEEVPANMNLVTSVYSMDDSLVIFGSVTKDNLPHKLTGHFHLDISEPNGEMFCKLESNIRSRRDTLRPRHSHNRFSLKIPGIPDNGAVLTINYHPFSDEVTKDDSEKK